MKEKKKIHIAIHIRNSLLDREPNHTVLCKMLKSTIMSKMANAISECLNNECKLTLQKVILVKLVHIWELTMNHAGRIVAND